MNHITNNNASIEQMTRKLYEKGNGNSKPEVKSLIGKQPSFQEILQNKQKLSESSSELKFSKHASLRLQDRNIALSSNQMERLMDGANKAKSKGIQESLIMVDDMAFIVNTKSNTVITAVNELENSVFTNIDGAVIS